MQRIEYMREVDLSDSEECKPKSTKVHQHISHVSTRLDQRVASKPKPDTLSSEELHEINGKKPTATEKKPPIQEDKRSRSVRYVSKIGLKHQLQEMQKKKSNLDENRELRSDMLSSGSSPPPTKRVSFLEEHDYVRLEPKTISNVCNKNKKETNVELHESDASILPRSLKHEISEAAVKQNLDFELESDDEPMHTRGLYSIKKEIHYIRPYSPVCVTIKHDQSQISTKETQTAPAKEYSKTMKIDLKRQTPSPSVERMDRDIYMEDEKEDHLPKAVISPRQKVIENQTSSTAAVDLTPFTEIEESAHLITSAFSQAVMQERSTHIQTSRTPIRNQSQPKLFEPTIVSRSNMVTQTDISKSDTGSQTVVEVDKSEDEDIQHRLTDISPHRVLKYMSVQTTVEKDTGTVPTQTKKDESQKIESLSQTSETWPDQSTFGLKKDNEALQPRHKIARSTVIEKSISRERNPQTQNFEEIVIKKSLQHATKQKPILEDKLIPATPYNVEQKDITEALEEMSQQQLIFENQKLKQNATQTNFEKIVSEIPNQTKNFLIQETENQNDIHKASTDAQTSLIKYNVQETQTDKDTNNVIKSLEEKQILSELNRLDQHGYSKSAQSNIASEHSNLGQKRTPLTLSKKIAPKKTKASPTRSDEALSKHQLRPQVIAQADFSIPKADDSTLGTEGTGKAVKQVWNPMSKKFEEVTIEFQKELQLDFHEKSKVELGIEDSNYVLATSTQTKKSDNKLRVEQKATLHSTAKSAIDDSLQPALASKADENIVDQAAKKRYVLPNQEILSEDRPLTYEEDIISSKVSKNVLSSKDDRKLFLSSEVPEEPEDITRIVESSVHFNASDVVIAKEMLSPQKSKTDEDTNFFDQTKAILKEVLSTSQRTYEQESISEAKTLQNIVIQVTLPPVVLDEQKLDNGINQQKKVEPLHINYEKSPIKKEKSTAAKIFKTKTTRTWNPRTRKFDKLVEKERIYEGEEIKKSDSNISSTKSIETFNEKVSLSSVLTEDARQTTSQISHDDAADSNLISEGFVPKQDENLQESIPEVNENAQKIVPENKKIVKRKWNTRLRKFEEIVTEEKIDSQNRNKSMPEVIDQNKNVGVTKQQNTKKTILGNPTFQKEMMKQKWNPKTRQFDNVEVEQSIITNEKAKDSAAKSNHFENSTLSGQRISESKEKVGGLDDQLLKQEEKKAKVVNVADSKREYLFQPIEPIAKDTQTKLDKKGGSDLLRHIFNDDKMVSAERSSKDDASKVSFLHTEIIQDKIQLRKGKKIGFATTAEEGKPTKRIWTPEPQTFDEVSVEITTEPKSLNGNNLNEISLKFEPLKAKKELEIIEYAPLFEPISSHKNQFSLKSNVDKNVGFRPASLAVLESVIEIPAAKEIKAFNAKDESLKQIEKSEVELEMQEVSQNFKHNDRKVNMQHLQVIEQQTYERPASPIFHALVESTPLIEQSESMMKKIKPSVHNIEFEKETNELSKYFKIGETELKSNKRQSLKVFDERKEYERPISPIIHAIVESLPAVEESQTLLKTTTPVSHDHEFQKVFKELSDDFKLDKKNDQSREYALKVIDDQKTYERPASPIIHATTVQVPAVEKTDKIGSKLQSTKSVVEFDTEEESQEVSPHFRNDTEANTGRQHLLQVIDEQLLYQRPASPVIHAKIVKAPSTKKAKSAIIIKELEKHETEGESQETLDHFKGNQPESIVKPSWSIVDQLKSTDRSASPSIHATVVETPEIEEKIFSSGEPQAIDYKSDFKQQDLATHKKTDKSMAEADLQLSLFVADEKIDEQSASPVIHTILDETPDVEKNIKLTPSEFSEGVDLKLLQQFETKEKPITRNEPIVEDVPDGLYQTKQETIPCKTKPLSSEDRKSCKTESKVTAITKTIKRTWNSKTRRFDEVVVEEEKIAKDVNQATEKKRRNKMVGEVKIEASNETKTHHSKRIWNPTTKKFDDVITETNKVSQERKRVSKKIAELTPTASAITKDGEKLSNELGALEVLAIIGDKPSSSTPLTTSGAEAQINTIVKKPYSVDTFTLHKEQELVNPVETAITEITGHKTISTNVHAETYQKLPPTDNESLINEKGETTLISVQSEVKATTNQMPSKQTLNPNTSIKEKKLGVKTDLTSTKTALEKRLNTNEEVNEKSTLPQIAEGVSEQKTSSDHAARSTSEYKRIYSPVNQQFEFVEEKQDTEHSRLAPKSQQHSGVEIVDVEQTVDPHQTSGSIDDKYKPQIFFEENEKSKNTDFLASADKAVAKQKTKRMWNPKTRKFAEVIVEAKESKLIQTDVRSNNNAKKSKLSLQIQIADDKKTFGPPESPELDTQKFEKTIEDNIPLNRTEITITQQESTSNFNKRQKTSSVSTTKVISRKIDKKQVKTKKLKKQVADDQKIFELEAFQKIGDEAMNLSGKFKQQTDDIQTPIIEEVISFDTKSEAENSAEVQDNAKATKWDAGSPKMKQEIKKNQQVWNPKSQKFEGIEKELEVKAKHKVSTEVSQTTNETTHTLAKRDSFNENIKQPIFLKSVRSVDSRVCEPAVFSCQIEGQPAPEVKWYVGIDLIEPPLVGYTLIDDDDEKTYSLIVETPSLEDNKKQVRCVISNVAGSANSTATLTVQKGKFG